MLRVYTRYTVYAHDENPTTLFGRLLLVMRIEFEASFVCLLIYFSIHRRNLIPVTTTYSQPVSIILHFSFCLVPCSFCYLLYLGKEYTRRKISIVYIYNYLLPMCVSRSVAVWVLGAEQQSKFIDTHTLIVFCLTRTLSLCGVHTESTASINILRKKTVIYGNTV